MIQSRKKYNIAIIGAGAIGSLIGGILAGEGHDITLIGNRDHMETIENDGLKIDGVKGNFKVEIKTDTSLDFKPDMVFVAVKTQDVDTACHNIKDRVRGIPVVMMQNGIRSTTIASEIFGEDSVISCILLLNARFTKPGHVTYIKEAPIIIGNRSSENMERLEILQLLFNHVAKTVINNNIIGVQWSKLFINALGNSLDGMTGLTLGEYIDHTELRKIGIRILKEALRSVEKAGIKLEDLPGIPMSFFKYIIKLPTPIGAGILKRLMTSKSDDETMTSTLQSLKKGKKTEIDYINGEFVKLSEKSGLNAPYNKLAVELIHTIENTGKFYTPDELISKFASIS